MSRRIRDDGTLQCPHGSYLHTCDRPVTQLAVSAVETVERLAIDPAFRKLGPDIASTAVRALHCNVHAAGAKRGYSPERFIPLTDERADNILKLARREYERQDKADADALAEKRAENATRAAQRIVNRWAERDAEPDYDVEYREDPRFYYADSGRVDRSYQAFDAATPKDQREYRAILKVEVDDKETELPAYITTRSSSNLTPKAARVLADMLIKAAEKAEATTAERKAARS